MPEIFVIKQIKMTHSGPVNQCGQPIHLQQGSLDGACGPYSLMMALTICGVVREHDKLLNLDSVRKNSATGRALIKMHELSSEKGGLLFRCGTDLEDLQEIANAHGIVVTDPLEARKIHKNSKEYKATGKEIDTNLVKRFVVEKIEENVPVVLWMGFENGRAHWSVVVGVEYFNQTDRFKRRPSRFLILDPDSPTSTISAWNGAIILSKRADWHSWGTRAGAMRVRFDRALAISVA